MAKQNTSGRQNRRVGLRVGRRAAVVAAVLITFASAAAADVIIQNFMDVEFNAGAPPCLVKVAGEDTASFPDGFAFDATAEATVDGVQVTQEHITINGVTGDRVLADEVYRIENNCTVPLTVSIVNAVDAGDWTGKHLEVWLGNTTATGAFPAVTPEAGSTEWDQAPIIIGAGGVTNAATGTVVLNAGESVPVGMVVTTGRTATGSGTATWQVQALAP